MYDHNTHTECPINSLKLLVYKRHATLHSTDIMILESKKSELEYVINSILVCYIRPRNYRFRSRNHRIRNGRNYKLIP